MAADRRDLPSGNGARCLVGKCVCANSFESKYGCSKCSVQLKPTFSYSNEGVELTTKVRGKHHELVDLCDFPSGGATCKVGSCVRDEDNKTLECPGDRFCDAAGSGGGVCVGADGSEGICVCGRGYFCSDCSLHESDISNGAHCDLYITGGALCKVDTDCGPDVAGYCATPKWHDADYQDDTAFDRAANLIDRVPTLNKAFCKCESDWTCRRCEKVVSDLERDGERCDCDEPIFEPAGGRFNASRLPVELTAAPWDSSIDCEVLYQVHRIQNVPVVPLFGARDGIEQLKARGERLTVQPDGRQYPVVLEYDYGVASAAGKNAEGRNPPQLFVVYAVAVPRANLTWLVEPSRLVHSEILILNAAPRRHGVTLLVAAPALLVALLAAAPAVALGAWSPSWDAAG